VTAKRQRQRTATAIRLRSELHERIVSAAAERDVSVNWLINRAIEDYLPRLIPVNELRLVHPDMPLYPSRDEVSQP
jgi:hypothetical protein